jgi:hypothetical protein
MADGRLDLAGDIRVRLEERLGVLAPLADALAFGDRCTVVRDKSRTAQLPVVAVAAGDRGRSRLVGT